MARTNRKLRRATKNAQARVSKRGRADGEAKRAVGRRKRVNAVLVVQCCSKSLRKTVRAICDANQDQTLFDALVPVLLKAIRRGKARVSYLRVYTPDVKYHAEVTRTES